MKSHHTRLPLQEGSFLPSIASLLLLIASLLVGCEGEKNSNGITTFVVPRGDPPAQRIVWSPIDHSEILVTAGNMGPGGEIYILDIETRKKTVLAQTDAGSFREAVWAPDGENVLLVSGDNTQGFEPRGWWKMNVASGSLEYLADLGRTITRWSPDGKTIVTTAGGDLILKNTNTGTENVIHTGIKPIFVFDLSWSPDGQYLAFPAGERPSIDLYSVNIQTQQISRLSENEVVDQTAWSPAGNMLAFVSARTTPIDGKRILHLISSEGRCSIKIPNLDFVLSPTWSPDGKKLGYIGLDGIYFIDIEKLLGIDIRQGLCK
jgi:Tol biopolymer transport system component